MHEAFTGKVASVVYDRFGDFVLDTEDAGQAAEGPVWKAERHR